MRSARLLAVALAASVVAVPASLAAPTGTAAAQRMEFRTTTPLDEDAVRGIAEQVPDFDTARELRPGSAVVVRFDPAGRRWTVVARDRATGTALVSVDIDDTTGEVVATEALPWGDYPPRTARRDAVAAARAAVEHDDRYVVRAHFEEGTWVVDMFERDRVGSDPVVRVDVSDATGEVADVWRGVQVAWKMARGDREAFGGDVNERYVWLPLIALFLLVAVDWTRLRAWRNADVLATASLGISHELFLQGRIHASVPLAIPPLAWLLGRMAWTFLHGLPAPRRPARPRSRWARLAMRRVPTMLLVVLCVGLAGLRIGLAVDGGNVIDVGYAGVAGARLELAGEAPWGAMPDDNPRGDTYGPANYLAYVPATVLLDDPHDHSWGSPLPAAQATSVAADLLCVLLLAAIGWRWISRRGAVLLAAGWLACPWTLWAMASGVNDSIVAVPLLAAFLLVPRPIARGLLVGVAAMVKFAPIVALAPLLHLGSVGRRRQSLLVLLGGTVAVAVGLAWVAWRMDGAAIDDLRAFWARTVGFQSERGSPFSPWGLYGWDVAQRIAQVLVALLLVAAVLLPRARDAWQAAAGVAAATIAVQLVVTHWFYLYVPWFVGFVLLVAVAERERPVPEPADMLRP